MTVAEDIRGTRKAGADYGGFACCCSATKWQYDALGPYAGGSWTRAASGVEKPALGAFTYYLPTHPSILPPT
ncbi:hypothetical protein FBZ93_1118 [Bradyrhizobium macuxiense]|uniref:Uncharacterized protein n=1 Tax=Bradyrhizobium macuxiense TaxID=1755647 RepID=A0A560LCN3_9BRAD|nr:hypothetical protein FBZ93_1118 [Bradyrhizobium macuxiense]